MPNLRAICQKIEGHLKGDPNLDIRGVNSLHLAGKGEITFCANPKTDISSIQADALIVQSESPVDFPNLIYVANPYLAFAQLLEFFKPRKPFCDGIDASAIVSPEAKLGKHVRVGAMSYVGDGCQVDDHTEIHSGVVIYPNVKIGAHCLIYSKVVIREGVEIGDHAIIHPGVVIGGDGFGFAMDSDGIPRKIPQKGKVVIGNHVEIGSNCCIDRSTLEETLIEDHVKMDNLVQVGHNVKIGQGTRISGQTGIAGSVNIGKNVVTGGQVGIADHLTIEDEVMIAAKTGITGNVLDKGITIAGYPHQDIRIWRKSQVILRNMQTYIDRIKKLEKRIQEMENK